MSNMGLFTIAVVQLHFEYIRGIFFIFLNLSTNPIFDHFNIWYKSFNRLKLGSGLWAVFVLTPAGSNKLGMAFAKVRLVKKHLKLKLSTLIKFPFFLTHRIRSNRQKYIYPNIAVFCSGLGPDWRWSYS